MSMNDVIVKVVATALKVRITVQSVPQVGIVSGCEWCVCTCVCVCMCVLSAAWMCAHEQWHADSNIDGYFEKLLSPY